MRCITNWSDLRLQLGEPKTILCLGNGPSSESAALEEVKADRLFRVNWVWRTRGRHADPDLVFTADPDLPARCDPPIICFPTRGDADRILAGYLSVADTTLAPDYLIFADMDSPLTRKAWPHQPTNGALMVAAAAQLRPTHIVIAGIDLYQHPHGRYPGSSCELNEYDAIHHRDTDLAFIRAALEQFGGHVTIMSEQLRAAL